LPINQKFAIQIENILHFFQDSSTRVIQKCMFLPMKIDRSQI